MVMYNPSASDERKSDEKGKHEKGNDYVYKIKQIPKNIV